MTTLNWSRPTIKGMEMLKDSCVSTYPVLWVSHLVLQYFSILTFAPGSIPANFCSRSHYVFCPSNYSSVDPVFDSPLIILCFCLYMSNYYVYYFSMRLLLFKATSVILLSVWICVMCPYSPLFYFIDSLYMPKSHSFHCHTIRYYNLEDWFSNIFPGNWT